MCFMLRLFKWLITCFAKKVSFFKAGYDNHKSKGNPVPADLQSAGLEYGDLQSPKYVSRLPITCWFSGQR